MKKFILFITSVLVFNTSFANVYWCPPIVNWNDLIANYYVVDNFWKLNNSPSYTGDPIFKNMAAVFDGKSQTGQCNYVNSQSSGLSLQPIATTLNPVFHQGIAWQWENNSKEWAFCNGTFCPFTTL